MMKRSIALNVARSQKSTFCATLKKKNQSSDEGIQNKSDIDRTDCIAAVYLPPWPEAKKQGFFIN